MQLKSGWTVTLGFVPWKVLNSGVDRLEGNLETIKWCDWNVVLPLGSLVDWEIRRSLQVSFFPAHSQILDWWWFGEAPSGEDEKVQVSKAKFTDSPWRFLRRLLSQPFVCLSVSALGFYLFCPQQSASVLYQKRLSLFWKLCNILLCFIGCCFRKQIPTFDVSSQNAVWRCLLCSLMSSWSHLPHSQFGNLTINVFWYFCLKLQSFVLSMNQMVPVSVPENLLGAA